MCARVRKDFSDDDLWLLYGSSFEVENLTMMMIIISAWRDGSHRSRLRAMDDGGRKNYGNEMGFKMNICAHEVEVKAYCETTNCRGERCD